MLNPGPQSAGRAFVVFGSLSGSVPGLRLGPGMTLPLNPDPVFFATAVGAFHGQFPYMIGFVPANGRTVARVDFPAGAFGFASGFQLTFAHVIWLPLSAVSNPVAVDIVR